MKLCISIKRLSVCFGYGAGAAIPLYTKYSFCICVCAIFKEANSDKNNKSKGLNLCRAFRALGNKKMVY